MQQELLPIENKRQFQKDLINWYTLNKRQLPWRKNRDPYRVWVSEIMLQQTRVDTVIPYYNRFMEKFPTIDALANADEQSVLKAWEGLGYYSRVKNLQTAVREVHEQYSGKVPNDKTEILSLKGIGPYTAGAILSIAFGIPEPAVDGNVMRVISRIMAIYDDINKQTTRKKIEAIICDIISKTDPSSFNQGLMELGALICTPTSPSCTVCPLQMHCLAFKRNIQKELPVKLNKSKQKNVKIACAWLINEHNQLLIHQRPNSGLLAQLWELPNVPYEKEPKQSLVEFLKNICKLDVDVVEKIFNIEHVFSHLKWDVTIYEVKLLQVVEEGFGKWVNIEEVRDYPFPASFQKMINFCLKEDEDGFIVGE